MKYFIDIMQYLALTLLILPTIAGAMPHTLERIYEKRLFEVHEFDEVNTIADKHHEKISVDLSDANVPILGCGPMSDYHKKEKELSAFASFTDVASVLHDEDEACIIAHVKGSLIHDFDE